MMRKELGKFRADKSPGVDELSPRLIVVACAGGDLLSVVEVVPVDVEREAGTGGLEKSKRGRGPDP